MKLKLDPLHLAIDSLHDSQLLKLLRFTVIKTVKCAACRRKARSA
jgi:hypothetical protein